MVWSGQAQGGLWKEAGIGRSPPACWGWRGLGVFTENSALASSPSTRGEDGKVLGRPINGSHGTCPGGMGPLEELSQLKAAVPDVAASGGQAGSSTSSL